MDTVEVLNSNKEMRKKIARWARIWRRLKPDEARNYQSRLYCDRAFLEQELRRFIDPDRGAESEFFIQSLLFNAERCVLRDNTPFSY